MLALVMLLNIFIYGLYNEFSVPGASHICLTWQPWASSVLLNHVPKAKLFLLLLWLAWNCVLQYQAHYIYQYFVQHIIDRLILASIFFLRTIQMDQHYSFYSTIRFCQSILTQLTNSFTFALAFILEHFHWFFYVLFFTILCMILHKFGT